MKFEKRKLEELRAEFELLIELMNEVLRDNVEVAKRDAT